MQNPFGGNRYRIVSEKLAYRPCKQRHSGFDKYRRPNKQQCRRAYTWPTPFGDLLDPVSLAVLAIYGGLSLLKPCFLPASCPGSRAGTPPRPGRVRVYFFLSSYLPLLWGDLLATYRLVNLADSVHPLVGAAIGVLVFSCGVRLAPRDAPASLAVARLIHPGCTTARNGSDSLRSLLLQPARHRAGFAHASAA